MTKPTRCGLLLVLLLMACPVDAARAAAGQGTPAAAGSTAAQGTEEAVDLEKLNKHRFERQALYRLSDRVARYLEAAEKASSGGDADRALTLLRRLDPDRLNPFERAYVYRLISVVQYGEGDYPGAVESLSKVLQEEVLFPEAENAIRFNIAQLYAAMQQWRNVVDTLHQWLRFTARPMPLAYYLLAVAHYQLDETDQAIASARQAVEIAPDPEESWLQLLAALYAQQSDFENALPVLEELLMRFPRKQYWVQLSLIYGARESYRNSLAVQQIAYQQGFLTEDAELNRLARSYLFSDLPHEAALVLEKGLEEKTIEPDAEAFELLANSWIQAREYDRALEPLRMAAELSEKGNLFVRLGQVFMQREDWGAAVEAFQRGIKKGELDHPGSVELLLGISFYNDHRVDWARSAFARARNYDATRKQADEWIEHIANETKSG
jgi:tetratricopeptide (TPR) repeat protein